jgi:transcriptional regulator
MYLPKLFEMTDPTMLQKLICDYPLATVVTHALNANHIPLFYDIPSGCLQGHVARANPLLQDIQSQKEVLAIFQGAQAYISPSWYPSKKMTHQVVPTWNYAVVHVYGTVCQRNEPEWLLQQLGKITEQQEVSFPEPWQLQDMPNDFLNKILKGIVGIEIQITRWEGKWKVSQNRTPEDQDGVIAGLESSGESVMAGWIRQFRKS